MWVYLKDAALSIVRHTSTPDRLMVRARFPGDLERAFALIGYQPRVRETPLADYRFRTEVPTEVVEGLMVAAVRGINYDNFKASVPEEWRHDHYLDLWMVGRREQLRQQPAEAAPGR
jgi:hypothetical protein